MKINIPQQYFYKSFPYELQQEYEDRVAKKEEEKDQRRKADQKKKPDKAEIDRRRKEDAAQLEEENQQLKDEYREEQWKIEAKLPGKKPMSVPIYATLRELQWLKNMLEDPQSDFLLPEELMEKLLHQLKEVPDSHENELWSPAYLYDEETRAPVYRQHLATIWQALTRKHKIHYVNDSHSGKVYEGESIPCRLQFNCITGKYSLIIWNETEDRAVKMDVGCLRTVKILPEKFDDKEVTEKFRSFLTDKKQQEIEILLYNQENRNALPRFYSRFESYPSLTVQDKENPDVYHVVMHYYAFDERDIVNGLMSMGPLVRVIGPGSLQDELRKNYQLARKRMQEIASKTGIKKSKNGQN